MYMVNTSSRRVQPSCPTSGVLMIVHRCSPLIEQRRAMTRDPEVYKNPECFRPERYLPTDGSAPESDPRQICFGFGRRSVQTVSIAVTNEMTDKHTAYVPVCPLSNISLDRTDVCVLLCATNRHATCRTVPITHRSGYAVCLRHHETYRQWTGCRALHGDQ